MLTYTNITLALLQSLASTGVPVFCSVWTSRWQVFGIFDDEDDALIHAAELADSYGLPRGFDVMTVQEALALPSYQAQVQRRVSVAA